MKRNFQCEHHAFAMAACLGLCLIAADATALTYSIQEINPDRSTLDASNPNAASGGRVNHLAVASDGQTMFAASEWGGLFKSTDGGDTWRQLPAHVPMATWDVAVDPNDSNRIYATSFYDGRLNSQAGINVSLDGGASWFHPVTATPPAGSCVGGAVRRDEPSAFGISIDPDNSAHVYIGTNCGLAVSTNRGLTWNFIDPTPGDLADDVWDVVVHDGGIIDLVGDDGHLRSTDGGSTWITDAVPIPAGISSIAVSPDEANVLFATTGTQIWESDDGGQNWSNLVNPRAQGRIPFVKTNKRSGSSFDLWFGDVTLNRTSCTTPAAGGTGTRCPSNSWNAAGNGAHADNGDVIFDPTTSSDACPLAMSSDGGVYINTVSTSPGCQTPTWEQPTITPHSLWLWDLKGVSYSGALNNIIIGRKSSVNMRYKVLNNASAGFGALISGGSGWGPGNYTTAVASGDIDGDGRMEYVIGRHANGNQRFVILDDAESGFAQLYSGGSNWGAGNYTTSVAMGDVDGDGLDEIIIGRRSNVNMRYEILDDANAGFAVLHTGGSGWGTGNYTTSVAAGDVDGDGMDEVIIGRKSNVNMRYVILDDANAGFAELYSGGSGWGVGNYTTAVAMGDVDGDGRAEVIIGRKSNVNMRYQILDDASAGFATLYSGGSGWGSGNYTTAVAAGDVDGDGRAEVIIGRKSNVNMRYQILDDATAGFAALHSGGSGWGSGNYTTSVAAGDVDNDGRAEVIIGRKSNVNMRYQILDDAEHGFSALNSGGSGWGTGNYTTAVAIGKLSGDRVDLYFGDQDTGTFAATNANAMRPGWMNRDCCDSFDVDANQSLSLVTVCCWSPGRSNRLFLRQPGMVGGAEINTYPPGNLIGFRPVNMTDQFGPNDFVAVTTSGVYITTNINASPITWTQLGAATTPAGARGVTAVGSGTGTTFFVQAPSGDLRNADSLWRYNGTAAGVAWQQINPPGGVGGFNLYAVDPSNPNRILVSYLQGGGAAPAMMMTRDGGNNWTALTALDTQITYGGMFVAQPQRGPTRFTGFGGYPQPMLAAISPLDPNLIVVGTRDSGIFVSTDGGTSWDGLSDPLNPAASGRPHIPRVKSIHFDHRPAPAGVNKVDLYVGTRGRGVFRISLEYTPTVSGGGVGPFQPCFPAPGHCGWVDMARGVIELNCTDPRRPCTFVDPIPKNCLVKFNCPGCAGSSLCPPYYRFYFDVAQADKWQFGLFTSQGRPVPYQLHRTGKGVMLEFRPNRKAFIKGRIANYLIGLHMRDQSRHQVYRIPVHLERADIPFKLNPSDRLK